MRQLRKGQCVLGFDEKRKKCVGVQVDGWLHRNPHLWSEFTVLELDQSSLTLTDTHVLFVSTQHNGPLQENIGGSDSFVNLQPSSSWVAESDVLVPPIGQWTV